MVGMSVRSSSLMEKHGDGECQLKEGGGKEGSAGSHVDPILEMRVLPSSLFPSRLSLLLLDTALSRLESVNRGVVG